MYLFLFVGGERRYGESGGAVQIAAGVVGPVVAGYGGFLYQGRAEHYGVVAIQAGICIGEVSFFVADDESGDCCRGGLDRAVEFKDYFAILDF